MTPERWQQIESIFHEALELETGDRASFLELASSEDPELRTEVGKLLDQFDEASSFIEQPLYDSAKSGVLSALLDDVDEDPMVGKVLGSYRIEREIGRGGMGAVYEAVRADGEFRLRVALKVVKRGVDTDYVLRRFRNERQILAALDHKYITRLIDGGTTDDGRPYFVMEFIDGLPLYRYSDRERLTIKDRLKLFCSICEAVEYAHQKRVIHRDLKPSNIFITNDGGPRLLDFGIAKLLDPEMAVDTLRPTATALRMMTVDYASPEQIRGEKITYATDVYSLGVILFELLTGFRPYAIASRSPHDVARAVCDDEPIVPSEALDERTFSATPVSSNITSLTEIAERRKATADEIALQIRGNLDNIILKALNKLPEERYASVTELRDDIERHLRGEDIAAYKTFTPPLRRELDDTGEGRRLVAVLPLSLMGPTGAESTDEAYLTVGLADAIITRLASVRKLTVRPTSSITRYNEHHVNPFRAGKELGVDFVLDGRIRRFGERLRISLQLLDVSIGSAIWAGQFDEHLTDVLELEDAISEQVAAALIPKLTAPELRQLSKRGTNNSEAYEYYLRGRFYWNQFTVESFGKAIQSFEKAVELDPEYALAYVGIADFYIWGNIYGLIPANESYRHAFAAARRAIEIDNQLGEAFASMGLIIANRYDPVEAERLMKKSIELAPHYSHSWEWYSAILVSTGRNAEAIEAMAKAEELDPLSLRTKTLVTWTTYQTRDQRAALAKADEIISLEDTYPQGHLQRGNILIELGRADEAVVETARAIELMPGSTLTLYNYCFALVAAGRRDDAVKVVEDMKAVSPTRFVKPYFLAMAHLAIGEIDETFRLLDISVDECDPWLVWLRSEPKLDPIRKDPRFLALIERTSTPVNTSAINPASLSNRGQTSLFNFEPITSPGSELPTLPFRPSFFRRHRIKFAVAGVLALFLSFGYWQGWVGIEFKGERYINETSKAPIKSIAVLPFENKTGEADKDYISDGMSEGLISRITGFREIRIVPRSTAFAFKNRALDPRSIGRELGVENVLTGILSKEGTGFLLRLEMTRVEDGKKVLSLSFVESQDRMFALQDRMSEKVIESLDLKAAGGSEVAQKSYTANNEAFQLYLKGEFNRQKGTPASLTEALGDYNDAIRLDANYALAYQGLALAYRSAPAYGSMPSQEAYPKAKEAALKALQLDPNLSTAYVSLASIKATFDWDFPGAEQEYKRAIQLAPNNAEAHYSYGNFLVAMGRSDEALQQFRNALQIDPLSLNVLTNIGWALYISGRNDEALLQVRQVIDRDPTFARAYLNLGEILLEQGKTDEAIKAYKNIKELAQDPLADMALGHAYGVAGNRKEAEKVVADLEERVRRKEVSSFLPAVVYAGLNDKDKAFYWLERAYQERSNWLTLIKVGRRLKTLRGDPRFDDLMKRVGFTE